MRLPVASLLLVLLSACLATAATKTSPSRTRPRASAKRQNSLFVSASGSEFQHNGSRFDFIGTNAYWLASLNNDKDINDTIHSIKAAGIKVIRTWAFNDVDEIPVNGTWLQLIKNGTFTVNEGPNGLQRLDKVVELAEQAGMFLILSLTNNWNPLPGIDNNTATQALERRDVTVGSNNTLPRNFLSNDYGGMDVYVRQLTESKTHDEFFQNQAIINAFKNYTTQIVSRYINSPAIFGWELANDARCNSTLPSAPSCVTTTVTSWHADLSSHVASVDPNHLVASGTHGFACMSCPKLFPLNPPPKPQPSPAPGKKKRRVLPLTKERVLRERTDLMKRNRAARIRSEGATAGGIKIRGRWLASHTARQSDSSPGSALDGAHGVDSQDILNIPTIGFGTFQLFPDQNVYGPDDPSLPPFNNTLQQGIQWIQTQSQLAQAVGKPLALTAFGLVSQQNAPAFVPFNTTTAPFASEAASSTPPAGNGTAAGGISSVFGVSPAEQDSAYSQWLSTSLQNAVGGAMQYQWTQEGLTPAPGTTIATPTNDNTLGTAPNTNTLGESPNDGYGISSTGADGVQGILSNAAASIGRD